jgi:hypothetical protein
MSAVHTPSKPSAVAAPNAKAAMRFRNLALAVLSALAALALIGCAPLAPRPSVDTADALASALPQSAPAEFDSLGRAAALADDGGELDSAAVTRRVLLRHPQLAAARARLEGAELDAWLIDQPAQPMLRLMPMLSEGRFRLEALLMQPLAEWLSRDLRTRLSQVEAERASAELIDQVLGAVIEAQRAFHAAIVAEHHAGLQTERVALAQQQLDLIEARLRSGETDAAALIESRAGVARERAQAARSMSMRVDARAALAAALGESSAAELRIPMQLPPLLQVLPPQPAQAIESGLREASPEIRSARLRVESAELRGLLLDHWSSRWMPRAGVAGMRGGDMSEARLELEVALPLWGRPDLEVDRAGASAREASALREAAERARALAAERALEALQPAQQELRAARAADAEAGRQYRLARALLSRGEGRIEAAWAARIAQLDAERETIEAESRLLGEALALQRLLGRFETIE